MLENLMCTEDLVSYNKYVASIFGVPSAVYIQQLINITCKAVRKKMVDEEGYFTLDRKFIEELTAITEKEQLEIDDKLIQTEVIIKPNQASNKIKLDITTLTTIVSSDDKQLIKNVENLAKRQPKKTKEEKNKDTLQLHIKTPDAELRDAYSSWIDSVVIKQGVMSIAAVENGQKIVEDFCKSDRQLMLKIINLAAINSWIDMNWAVNSYMRETNYNKNNRTSKPSVTTDITNPNRTLGYKVSLPF